MEILGPGSSSLFLFCFVLFIFVTDSIRLLVNFGSYNLSSRMVNSTGIDTKLIKDQSTHTEKYLAYTKYEGKRQSKPN